MVNVHMFKVKLVSSMFLVLFGLTTALMPATAVLAASTPSAPSIITIAVLDSGIDSSIQPLAGTVLPGYNVYNSTNNTQDTSGHGTWVADTAHNTFSAFKSSANPQASLTFLPITITDATGLGYTSTAVDGLRRAAASGAKIVNLSFELHGGTSDVTAAAHEFVQQGGIVFAAAGNDSLYYAQADNADIVSVGSVGVAGNPSSFSSSGPFVDIAAPGENIHATGPGNRPAYISGTSFAAPYAASVAALVWATNPTLTNTQVIEILKKTARDTYLPGKDDRTGFGIVDPAAAIAAAKNTATGASSPILQPFVQPPSPVIAQVLNDPGIPPMDPIYSHAPSPIKSVQYKSVKRYTRRWNTKTKRYYWTMYYARVRA